MNVVYVWGESQYLLILSLSSVALVQTQWSVLEAVFVIGVSYVQSYLHLILDLTIGVEVAGASGGDPSLVLLSVGY